MYKNDLQWTLPKTTENCNDGSCWKQGCEDFHTIIDSRGDCKAVENVAFLPHACDEWVIGGPEEIKSLIKDLQTYLEMLGEVPL